MSSDDFFLVNKESFDKLDNIMSEVRFDYRQNKKLWLQKNDIIIALNTYRKMPREKRIERVDWWLLEELKTRDFPLSVFSESTYPFLFQSIGTDCIYIDCLCRKSEVPVYNPFQFLGTINVLLKKHPIFFEEDIEKAEIAFIIVQSFHDDNILTQFPKQQAKLLKKQSKKVIKRFKKLDIYSLMDSPEEKKLTLDFIKKK